MLIGLLLALQCDAGFLAHGDQIEIYLLRHLSRYTQLLLQRFHALKRETSLGRQRLDDVLFRLRVNSHSWSLFLHVAPFQMCIANLTLNFSRSRSRWKAPLATFLLARILGIMGCLPYTAHRAFTEVPCAYAGNVTMLTSASKTSSSVRNCAALPFTVIVRH